MGERKFLIRKDDKWQMQPRHSFLLIGGVLRRQPVKLRDAKARELGEMIAEAARLRRAAARTRDLIPAGRRIDARNAGARVDVDHGAAFELRQIDRWPGRRRQ